VPFLLDGLTEPLSTRSPNLNIGYPKLFTGREESGAEISPQPPVNNFDADRQKPKSSLFMTDINQNIE
jgi:hypothetical protein